MQPLELKPNPLAALRQSNVTGELTIEYDDGQAALQSSSALALLGRNEYVLVLALLRQRQRWQETPGRIPFGLSMAQLMALVGSTSRNSVERQLQRAAMKVMALGIHIFPLHGSRQYMVLFTPELAAADPSPLPFTCA